MKLLPLLHNFQGKRCLIIGGGKIAARRADALARAGAKIDVVAPRVCARIKQHAVRVSRRAYQSQDARADYALIVAATDDRKINARIAADAKDAGVAVNVVDDAALCDVAFPSVIDRAPLMITVSTAGASPLLSDILRQRIDAMLPHAYGNLAALVGKFRKKVRAAIANADARAQFWRRVLGGAVAESVFSGKLREAEALLKREIANLDASQPIGEVYLIGAGPGDPDLLTLRAFRLLQNADVVIHDRLVSRAVLDLLRPDAELMDVGKRRAQHAVPQSDINEMLVKLAKAGKRVARLKGGDPFIFGRGGEEIEQLAAHEIPFQVIPGVTAALGCANYAGIPLTHRDHAQSVRFIAGQTKDDNFNWRELASPEQTLVFYMGLGALEHICTQLVRHALPETQPAALIENGTLPEQRVFTGTLADLPTLVKRKKIQSPALLIVGTVVGLREKLAWFESRGRA